MVAYFVGASDELRERIQSDPDAKVPRGQRRDQVFRLACSLVARGVPPDAILTTASAFNETRCEPPLEDAQVVEQVDGAVVGYQPGTALARNVTPSVDSSNSALIEPREVPTDIPGERFSCGLEGVLEAFGELLILPDSGPVKIALASVVANYAPGDVVWPLLVGPPGCGKSEIVTGAP